MYAYSACRRMSLRESETMMPAAPGARGGAWQLLWSRIFLGFVDLRL